MKTNKLNIKKGVFYLAISLCIGFLFFLALMCVFALVLSNVDLPLNLLPPLTLAITGIATGISAFVFAYLVKKYGLILGSCFGIFIYVIIIIISAIQGYEVLTQLSAIKAFTMISAGAFGGYIGMLKSVKKRKVRRNR